MRISIKSLLWYIKNGVAALGAEGMKKTWHDAKLRGRGYSRAGEIVDYAEKSVGLTDGTDAGREWIIQAERFFLNYRIYSIIYVSRYIRVLQMMESRNTICLDKFYPETDLMITDVKQQKDKILIRMKSISSGFSETWRGVLWQL